MKDFDINKMRSVRNVPFGSVPRELIECIHPNAYPPTYEEWMHWSSYLDKIASYYNIALLNEEDEIIAFEYGTWGPCGEGLHLIRVIIHPKYRENSKEIIERGLQSLRKLARELGVNRVYSITGMWRFFLEKLPNDLKEVDARVLEVTNV